MNQPATTSLGSCRAVILCVLYRCLEAVQVPFHLLCCMPWSPSLYYRLPLLFYVKRDYENNKSVQSPFPEQAIKTWISQGQVDSNNEEFQLSLGEFMIMFDGFICQSILVCNIVVIDWLVTGGTTYDGVCSMYWSTPTHFQNWYVILATTTGMYSYTCYHVNL